jgi:hypothetical protein
MSSLVDPVGAVAIAECEMQYDLPLTFGAPQHGISPSIRPSSGHAHPFPRSVHRTGSNPSSGLNAAARAGLTGGTWGDWTNTTLPWPTLNTFAGTNGLALAVCSDAGEFRMSFSRVTQSPMTAERLYLASGPNLARRDLET